MKKQLTRIAAIVIAVVMMFSVAKVFANDYYELDDFMLVMPTVTISATDRASLRYFDGVIEIPLFENLLVASRDFDFGRMRIIMHLDDGDLTPHLLYEFLPDGNVTLRPFFFDEVERTIEFSVSQRTELIFMPVYIRVPEIPFEDVTRREWFDFYVPIVWAYENEIMSGISATEFAPAAYMTRAMLVTVLWRYTGRPDAGEAVFSDVVSGRWYSEAVAWAAENGIVTGFSETTFGVNANVTREQMYTILYRYMNFAGLTVILDDEMRLRQFAGLQQFVDEDKISDWAWDALHFMYYAGVMHWRSILDNYTRPQENAIRGEIARALFIFDRLTVPQVFSNENDYN